MTLDHLREIALIQISQAQRTNAMTKIKGSDLKKDDMLILWFGRQRVTQLEPYNGPIAHLFKEGAQIATFDTGKRMTIDNGDYYDAA
jgi:hypothetical protein